MQASILIIIPVLNPDLHFFNTIIPMLNAQNMEAQILLISSSGELQEGEYQSIVINPQDFNHSNTRNMVLSYESDFYLFMTQDATPVNDSLLRSLIEPFNNQNVVVSYARQIPYKHAHITEKFSRTKNYPTTSLIKSKKMISELGIKTFFSSDSCAMYRSAYFKDKLGFTKDLNASEDMEFAARAIFDDKEIAYSAQAEVYHSHIYNIRTLYKRYLNIGIFFQENSWIQESIEHTGSTEKTGIKQAIEELKFIAKKEPTALFKSVLFSFVKYIAYHHGKS